MMLKYVDKRVDEKLAEGGGGGGNEELQAKVDELEAKIAELEAGGGSEEPQILFQAFRRSGETTGILSFEEVTINLGDGFQNDHFAAPVDGYYQFSYSGVSGLDASIETEIYVKVNGNPLWAIFDSNNAEHCNQMATTFYLQLAAGDLVQLETSDACYCRQNCPLSFAGKFLYS